MRLIKQYISSSVLKSTFVVLLAIASLDMLSTIVDEADSMRNEYNFVAVLEYTLFLAPKKLVTTIPFAVLIGVLFGLGSLASSSELTVMRAAGISVRRLGWYAMRGAFIVIFIGIFVAEFIAAPLELMAEANRNVKRMGEETITLRESERGFWGKESTDYFHVNTILPSGQLFGLVRFTFDENKVLESVSFTEEALYIDDQWLLQRTHVTDIAGDQVTTHTIDQSYWDSEMSPRVMQIVAADEEDLSIRDLYYYANYLDTQELDSAPYRLAFWQKVLQPLASLSLVFIAITFVFGPLRQVTMGFRIFTGVIVGIIFATVQHILGPVSLVYGLSPLTAVSLPIVICLMIGLLLMKQAK